MLTIFTTNRLIVRKLSIDDFESFHKMQSNINVMRYVRSKPMTFAQNKKELPKLIEFYDKKDNNFWIYAIIRKEDAVFVGTVAIVKDENNDDEIGYRLLEKYWGNGYGTEVFQELINYCKSIGLKKIIGCVATENIASLKILKKAGLQFVENFVSDNLNIPEQKYILEL